MAAWLTEVVAANGLADVITVLPKAVEQLTAEDIPEGEVDAIVSEWMGQVDFLFFSFFLFLFEEEENNAGSGIFSFFPRFGLLHEAMLDSVLRARDRWLTRAPHALLLPSHAVLYAAPSSLAKERADRLGFWDRCWISTSSTPSPFSPCSSGPVTDSVLGFDMTPLRSRALAVGFKEQPN